MQDPFFLFLQPKFSYFLHDAPACPTLPLYSVLSVRCMCVFVCLFVSIGLCLHCFCFRFCNDRWFMPTDRAGQTILGANCVNIHLQSIHTTLDIIQGRSGLNFEGLHSAGFLFIKVEINHISCQGGPTSKETNKNRIVNRLSCICCALLNTRTAVSSFWLDLYIELTSLLFHIDRHTSRACRMALHR